METETKPVDETTLPTVLGWWAARGCGEMPDELLPPCGVVSCDATGPAAAGWAYFSAGCPVAFLDWLVSRPGMSAGQTRAHLRAVVAALHDEAARRGVRYCLGSVSDPGMAREAARAGYLSVEGNFQHFIHFLRS